MNETCRELLQAIDHARDLTSCQALARLAVEYAEKLGELLDKQRDEVPKMTSELEAIG